MISTLIRQIPNIKDEDIRNNYQIIKDLNPDITDINKLSAGRLLVIPGKPLSEPGPNKSESKTEENAASAIGNWLLDIGYSKIMPTVPVSGLFGDQSLLDIYSG